MVCVQEQGLMPLFKDVDQLALSFSKEKIDDGMKKVCVCVSWRTNARAADADCALVFASFIYQS